MTLPWLLVPVFRGGSFFQEAVDSIKPCLPWFSGCIISLNGTETAHDRETAMQLAPLCKLHILATGKELTSVQHAFFIVKQIGSRLRLDILTEIFSLCHDDLLSIEGFKSLDQEDWSRQDPFTISLGDYLVFKDGEPIGSSVHKTSFEDQKSKTRKRPQSHFLQMQISGIDPFTNVSGMRMTVAVLSSTLSFYKYTGSRVGLRMEYAYICNRAVDSIINYDPPLVFIRSHPQSEGAKATYRDFIPGELRYLCWLWINCKTLQDLQALQKGRFNLRAFLWLTNRTIQHRYYDSLGLLRGAAVSLGLRQ